MKINSVGAELFHADRRTDVKMIVAFCNYANAPVNTFHFRCRVEMDRANSPLPLPAIRKTFLRNRRKHDNIRKKERKGKENKKSSGGGVKSQNCKFRHSLETAEVSISHC
jgi:hypothetical protein